MPTSLQSALLLVTPLFASTLLAQPFATSVVNYSPGDGAASGYSDPNAALGAPSTQVPGFPTGTDPVTAFNPPFLPNQLVSLGVGGSLTLDFASPILNDPTNPFGLDFLVFGNNGFTITNGDFSGGGVTDGTLFTFDPAGTSKVFVSADNIHFFELIVPTGLSAQLDALFPTDGTGNFQKPVDPSLANADFAGKNLAAIRALYNGSGGGTGFDLSWARTEDGQPIDLQEVRYVRFEVLSGKIEVDGVAVVPEPGTWALILLGLGAGWAGFRASQGRKHGGALARIGGPANWRMPVAATVLAGSSAAVARGACLKNCVGPCYLPKGRMARSEVLPHGGHTRQRSLADEQQRQTATITLRVAGLLSAACVGSAVTALCGDAGARAEAPSPPWPSPKSLATGPHAIFRQAPSWSDNFAVDPASRGWRAWGEKELFSWSPTEESLRVTWDSSRSNSYFMRSLGTVLTKSDDFRMEFDLRLNQIAIGTSPGRPSTFEIALGFVGFASVTHSNFFRAAGRDPTYGPRNLVEFDYFPDFSEPPFPPFGATVAPTVVSTNNQITFSDNHPLEMETNRTYHVTMTYTASNQVLRSIMTRDGVPFGILPGSTLRDLSLAGLADFRVDTFAVANYNEGQQHPPESSGSIQAEGWVDNIVVVTPPPPISGFTGRWVEAGWQVEFAGRSGWIYALERSGDLRVWAETASRAADAVGRIALTDPQASLEESQFYRIRAERP